MSTDIAVSDGTTRDAAVADPQAAAGALAHILGTGDLAQLTDEQRVGHYLDVCASLGLNPRTRPFDWIEFYDPETRGKKLALYPNRSCAEQLRRQHQISVRVVRREMVGELFVVEVEGTTPNSRTGTASKYVSVLDRQGQRLRGTQLANAYMKAETGALRRLTFSMVGMASPPDVDELSRVRVVTVDGLGQVLDRPTEEQRYLAKTPAAAAAIGEPTFETTGGAERAPLAGTAGQQVRREELERPARPAGPRPSFRPSDEDVKLWLAAWFATVNGLSLDTDDARHAFVESWTRDELGWPEGKRTDSLKTMLARMTDTEAGVFLAHVRALMEDEKRELLDWANANPDMDGVDGMTPEQAHAEAVRQGAVEPPKATRRHPDQRVHDAVQLTGGPRELAADDGDGEPEQPAF